MAAFEDITIEFNNENSIIELPCVNRPGVYHYGSETNFQRFRYSYFIKNICHENEKIMNTKIISNVEYQPDSYYNKLDGYFGKCWVVSIIENEKEVKYYIRNWIDIVEYFNEKGFKFVEEKI